MIVFIGFGNLAKSLLPFITSHDEIKIFNKNPEKVTLYQNVDKRVSPANIECLKTATNVFILLPSTAYDLFFEKYGSLFHKKTVFYHFATALMQEEVEKLIPNRKVIPCKCVGQSEQMAKDNRGMLLIPPTFEKEIKWLRKLFDNRFRIMKGDEEEALIANQLATKAAIEMAVNLKMELQDKGFSKEIIEQSISITTRGVINSYLEGKLGGFGKKIQKQIEDN